MAIAFKLRMKRIFLTFFLFIGIIAARPQDMPRFGGERLFYLPALEQGQLQVGGRYSPYYIDSDSTNITMNGNFSVGILDWLSLHAWYPHFSDTRLGRLKAGPGDAIVSASVDWQFPLLSSLRGGAFIQTSLPTGYTGEHPDFPAYTSHGNDLCYGGALGFSRHEVFDLTFNFSVSSAEQPTVTYYNPGAGFMVHLPWQIDAGIEYFTDFTANPSHEINLRLAKKLRFAKGYFAFKKDFRDPAESFGYCAGLDFEFQMFEVHRTTPKNVRFMDMTDWNQFPGMDTVWSALDADNQKMSIDADSFVVFELRMADFISRREEKTVIPLLVEKDQLRTRYALNIQSIDQRGEKLDEWNIYGEDISDSQTRFIGDNRSWDVMFTDRAEMRFIKTQAMKDLYDNLMKETKRYNRGRF